MTDHKFEPFQKVLVRDHVEQRWKANFFSHMDANYFVTGYSLWQYCIPYTPETSLPVRERGLELFLGLKW